MNLPRPTYPWRAIRVAASLCIILGLFLLAIGLVGTVAMYHRGPYFLLPLMVYGGIGGSYVFLGTRINRRQSWAAIAAICFSCIGLVIPLYSLGIIIRDFLRSPAPEAFVVITMGFVCLVLLIVALALGVLILQLARALKAIRILLEEERIGFEVLAKPL